MRIFIVQCDGRFQAVFDSMYTADNSLKASMLGFLLIKENKITPEYREYLFTSPDGDQIECTIHQETVFTGIVTF